MANVDKECEVCKKKAKHSVAVLGFQLCRKHYNMKIEQEQKNG